MGAEGIHTKIYQDLFGKLSVMKKNTSLINFHMFFTSTKQWFVHFSITRLPVSPLLWTPRAIAVGRYKGKSLVQRPAHTSVSEFRLRPQDHATSSYVLKTSQDRDLTASLGTCSFARLTTLWLFFFFFQIKISPLSVYKHCQLSTNQTQSDFISISNVELKKIIHSFVGFIKALVGHSKELWSISHL